MYLKIMCEALFACQQVQTWRRYEFRNVTILIQRTCTLIYRHLRKQYVFHKKQSTSTLLIDC